MIRLKKILWEIISAEIQPASIISPEFIAYIKSVENPHKEGYKNGKWYPIPDPSAGMIIGYGHQLAPNELELAKRGMSDEMINKFLYDDIKKAQHIVKNAHLKWVESTIQKYEKNQNKFKLKPNDPLFKLNNNQLEMLTDFVYNLGSLNAFPKFTNAVFRKDWDTAKMEYKRKFKDRSGKTRELTSRNNNFFNRFLSDK